MAITRKEMDNRLNNIGMVVSIMFFSTFLLEWFYAFFYAENRESFLWLVWRAFPIFPTCLYMVLFLLYGQKEKPSWFLTLYSLMLAGNFFSQMQIQMRFPSEGGFRPDYPTFMSSVSFFCFLLALGRFRVLLVTYLLPISLGIFSLWLSVDHFSYYFLFFLDRYKITLFVIAILLLSTWSIDRVRSQEWITQEKIQRQRERNRQWMQLNRFKDEFLRNTSLELRAPVQGIIGIAESLLKNSKETISQEFRKGLTLMINSGRRLNYLINDILDATKLKYNKISLDLRPVSFIRWFKTFFC